MSGLSINLKDRGIPGSNSPEPLRRLFEPPEWFDEAQASEIASFYPELTLRDMYSVASALGVVETLDKFPEEVENIFEFGSGWGEGLVSLDMFARRRGSAVVTGSEVDEDVRVFSLQVTDLLPSVQNIRANGINALEEAEGQFDVVVAHMLGPSYYNDRLPSLFISTALTALKSSGVVIINSDFATMGHTNSWVERHLAHEQVEVVDLEACPPGLNLWPLTVITKQ